MTPEGRVKKQVKTLLEEYKCWYFMPVSAGLGRHGIPDFIGCVRGRAFCIETKAFVLGKGKAKQPTRLQQLEMDDMAKAGFKVFVVSEPHDLARVSMWLEVVAGAQ